MRHVKRFERFFPQPSATVKGQGTLIKLGCYRLMPSASFARKRVVDFLMLLVPISNTYVQAQNAMAHVEKGFFLFFNTINTATLQVST